MKPLHIFKPGKHTASDGTAIEFTEAMVQSLVSSYDPQLHEAPIVIGHPRDNGPAYGWVKALKLVGADVEAEPHQVHPAFAEMVAAGSFKKRSASLYSPDSPSNPKPGQWYLRHLGFLGAQPPAIKGLRDPQFREGEEGVVEFMDQEDAGVLAPLFRRLRDFLIDQFGVDKADSAIPDWIVADMEHQARTPPDKTPVPGFSEPGNNPGAPAMTPEQQATLDAREKAVKEQEDSVAAKKAEMEAKEKAFAEQQAAADRAAVEARVDSLVKEGKLTPAERDKAVHIAQRLGATDQIEFTEGETKTNVPVREVFFELVSTPGKKPEFGERRMDPGAEGDGKVNPVEHARKIREYRADQRAKGNDVSYAEASAAVLSGTS